MAFFGLPGFTPQEDEAFNDLERRRELDKTQPAKGAVVASDPCSCSVFGEDRGCPVHGHDA